MISTAKKNTCADSSVEPYLRSQGGVKLYSRIWQPLWALNKGLHCELGCLTFWESGIIAGPLDPLRHAWSWPSVLVLSIKYGVWRVNVGNPAYPPHRFQEWANIRLHDDSGGVVFPRPAKVRVSLKTVECREWTFLDNNSSVHVGVLLALSCDGVELVW